MSAPLVVNTRDGVCWTRRTVTPSGIALYAPESVQTCPNFVMATLAELAEHGIAGSADVLPVPVGTAPKPRTPVVGDRYVKRAAPDQGRVVTVNRVWTADDGHTAVAYEWDEPRVSYAGSACPLDVFHRTYAAELEAAPVIVYRAEHPDSGITLGHYGTEKAARAHCEATERRSWPTGTTLSFDWIEDEDDGVAELVVTAGQNDESTTGYTVTALEVPSEYDEEADE